MTDKLVFVGFIFIAAIFIGSFINLRSLRKGFFETLWLTLTVVPIVSFNTVCIVIEHIFLNIKSPIVCFSLLVAGFIMFPYLVLELANEPAQDIKIVISQKVTSLHSSLSTKDFRKNVHNV